MADEHNVYRKRGLMGGRSINCYFFKFKLYTWYLYIPLTPIVLTFLILLFLVFMYDISATSQHALNVKDALHKGETKIYTVGGFITVYQFLLSITSSAPQSAYILPHMPSICPEYASSFTITKAAANLPSSHLNVFMMEQSLFTVTFTFTTRVNFYVVNGEGNYDTLVNSGASSIDPSDIAYSRLGTTVVDTDFIGVGKTGEYYFVALANETATVNGNFRIVVKKSVYCTDTATQSVLNSTDINMPVNLYRNTIVVVKNEGFPNNTGTEDVINLVTYSEWYIVTITSLIYPISVAMLVILIAVFVVEVTYKSGLAQRVNQSYYDSKAQKKPFFGVLGHLLARELGINPTRRSADPAQSAKYEKLDEEEDFERSGGVELSESNDAKKYISQGPILPSAPVMEGNFASGDRVRVVRGYLSTEKGHLSLREGDEAVVMHSVGNGLVQLDFNGLRGAFPEAMLIKDVAPSLPQGEPDYPPADATVGYMPSMDVYSADPTTYYGNYME